MRHGKDYMTDKPGMTSLDQLEEVRRVQAQTKRIYSVCYSEHFETRSTVKAGELVAAGAIGKVDQHHRAWPAQAQEPAAPATGSTNAERQAASSPTSPRINASSSCSSPMRSMLDVVAATVANRANPEKPELQDFGEHAHARRAR